MTVVKGRLTERPKEVFDFIILHKRQNDGNSPSHRQIIENTSITSTSVVRYYLNKLQELNLIEGSGKHFKTSKVIGGKSTYKDE